MIDVVVADEAEGVAVAKQYLSYFQGPLPTWESAEQALLRDTPLWFYVLRESEVRRGGGLAGVGARIVAETFHRALEGSASSIVRDTAFRPTLGPDDQTFRMVDLLLFAFEGKKALLAPLLARPSLAGHMLVAGLPAAERRPEAARVHRAKRRDRLGDDRGVVALARGVDDAERQARGLQRSAERDHLVRQAARARAAGL